MNIVFPSDSIGFLTLDSNQIYKTEDYGDSWTLLDNITSEKLNDFDFPSNLIGYAAGDNGIIYKTEDGGLNWQNEPSGITYDIKDIECPSDTIAYILTTNNIIWSNYYDYGNEFAEYPIATLLSALLGLNIAYLPIATLPEPPLHVPEPIVP
jgi:hypothetical protein